MPVPTHLLVHGLMRQVQAAGGFATVIAKGERDAGTLLLVLTDRGALPRAFERMPQADGSRAWARARQRQADDSGEFDAYLKRRREQDPDLWIVELDIGDAERFIEALPD